MIYSSGMLGNYFIDLIAIGTIFGVFAIITVLKMIESPRNTRRYVTAFALLSAMAIATSSVAMALPAREFSCNLPCVTQLNTSGKVLPDTSMTNPLPLYNVVWDSAPIDENGIFGTNHTAFTVRQNGWYEVIFSGGMTSTGQNHQFSRFHAGIVSFGSTFQYATGEVQFASNQPSLWLDISFYYHITNPPAQFIYAQIEPNDNNTQLAQARMQIIFLGPIER